MPEFIVKYFIHFYSSLQFLLRITYLSRLCICIIHVFLAYDEQMETDYSLYMQGLVVVVVVISR